MSLDRHLEPNWVNDYDERDDELDPDYARDARLADEAYERWLDDQIGGRP